MGSLGQLKHALYGQLRALLLQIETSTDDHLRALLLQIEMSTGMKVLSESALFVSFVRHAQWLLNRYLIGSGGKIAYSRRWGKHYQGPLCMFGACVDVKYVKGNVGVPKATAQWFTGMRLGKGTEAYESIIGTSEGVYKLCTLKRKLPSQPRNATMLGKLTSARFASRLECDWQSAFSSWTPEPEQHVRIVQP